MKYYIGWYKWKKFKRTIKEWYISDDKGTIVAGDFSSYTSAKKYLNTTLLRRR